MQLDAQPTAAPDRHRVGLVVVHGIGEQRPGETAGGIVEGIEDAYGREGYVVSRRPVAEGEEGGALYYTMEPRPAAPDVPSDLPEIYVYEAFWAPILSGPPVDGSFRIERPQQFIWFPWLNRWRVHGFAAEYSRPRVWLWTLGLIFIGGVLTAAYRALPTLGKALRWLRESLRPATTSSGKRNPLDRFLDRRVGDIFNYVDSAGDAGGAVPEAEERIQEVFRRALERAADDGCTEVQVLAHSLGTVIVYRALTVHREQLEELVSFQEPRTDPPRLRLTRLYTIGSPLEKIRFFWPKLVATNGERFPPSTLKWDNFRSPGDPVAGVIGDLDVVPHVDNHTVAGAGGLLTAHNRYRRHPSFQAEFGKALTGRAPARRARWPRLTRWLAALGEGGWVFGGLGLLALLGLTFMIFEGGVLAWVVYWLVGELLAWGGLPAWAVGLIVALVPVGGICWALAKGLLRGMAEHDEHWRGDYVLERRKKMTVSDSSSTDTRARPYRNPRNAAILVANFAILVAIGWIGWWQVKRGALQRPTAWLLILALMTLFVVLLGLGIKQRLRGALIDYRNKLSLSRLQIVAWTLLILSAFIAAVLSNVAAGEASPLSIVFPSQIWVLLGISTAAAVGSPAVLSSKRGAAYSERELDETAEKLRKESGVAVDKRRSGAVVYNCDLDDARWGDLFMGDQAADATTVDVGKLQMFFFTFVLVLGYGAAIWTMFEGSATTTRLPPVDDSMNVLLGISQTGYLASKTVSSNKPRDAGSAQGKPDALTQPEGGTQ